MQLTLQVTTVWRRLLCTTAASLAAMASMLRALLVLMAVGRQRPAVQAPATPTGPCMTLTIEKRGRHIPNGWIGRLRT